MPAASYWDEAYRSGRPPWDPGPYDRHLDRILTDHAISPTTAIDIGCGDGKSVVWLAKRGFDVTGIDVAPTAVSRARAHAEHAGVEVRLVLGAYPDTVSDDSWNDRFSFAVDRGFFHLNTARAEYIDYLRTLTRILRRGGIFYTLIAKREGAKTFGGPPKWREHEITQAVGEHVKIRELRAGVFTPGEAGSMPAWILVGENV